MPLDAGSLFIGFWLAHSWYVNCLKIEGDHMNELEIFKEISVGGLTKEQLMNQLVQAGIQFNEYANILFDHTSFSPGAESARVNLFKVKQSDLGITKACTFQEIVSKASFFGLKLCPLYLGAFLRLEYMEQPGGPYLTVASAKPESDENYPNGFYVRNLNNSLWLRGYRATDDYEWPIENEFIFLK